MKKLLLSSLKVSSTLNVDQALDKLVKETTDNVNCDRASVYLVDHVNKELITKVASGISDQIRIPLGVGIAGSVAQSGSSENIEDAYADTRFNSRVDKETNYKTNTILAVPVRDFEGNVVAVI
jgi:signal transduction protein with GAF and PtsI domain